MKAYIVTTFIGCFAVKDNKIVSQRIFHRDIEKIAETLKASETELVEEEKDLMKELTKKGLNEIVFSSLKPGVKLSEPGNNAEQYVKENLRELAIKYGFVKDQVAFGHFFSIIHT